MVGRHTVVGVSSISTISIAVGRLGTLVVTVAVIAVVAMVPAVAMVGTVAVAITTAIAVTVATVLGERRRLQIQDRQPDRRDRGDQEGGEKSANGGRH